MRGEQGSQNAFPGCWPVGSGGALHTAAARCGWVGAIICQQFACGHLVILHNSLGQNTTVVVFRDDSPYPRTGLGALRLGATRRGRIARRCYLQPGWCGVAPHPAGLLPQQPTKLSGAATPGGARSSTLNSRAAGIPCGGRWPSRHAACRAHHSTQPPASNWVASCAPALTGHPGQLLRMGRPECRPVSRCLDRALCPAHVPACCLPTTPTLLSPFCTMAMLSGSIS